MEKLSTYLVPKYQGCVFYCHFIGLGWGNVFNWKYVQNRKLRDFITIFWIILSSVFEISSGKKWQLKWRLLVLLNHIDSALRILRKINWTHFVAFKNYVGRNNKHKTPEPFSSISLLRCESACAALPSLLSISQVPYWVGLHLSSCVMSHCMVSYNGCWHEVAGCPHTYEDKFRSQQMVHCLLQ